MPNGTAVRLPVDREPPAASAPSGPSQTDAELAIAIGQAVASAACAVCFGAMERANDGLTPATKLAAGARIAALYQLQQDHAGTIDFAAVARAAGRQVLRRYLDADFYQGHSPAQGEAACDEIITCVLEILGNVTAHERARLS